MKGMPKRNISSFGRINKKQKTRQEDIQRKFSQKYGGVKKCDKYGSWQGRRPLGEEEKDIFLSKKR